MDQEQHVAQLDRAIAVVLGQLIGVEPGEGPREAALHLLGERPAAVPPIDGEELGELVGPLDHPLDGVGHQRGSRARVSQDRQQHQRRVTQVEHLARLDGQGRHDRGVEIGRQRGDTVGDGLAVLVELVLPQEAGEHRAAQGLFGRQMNRRRALVRDASAGDLGALGEDVDTHGANLLTSLNGPIWGKGENASPNDQPLSVTSGCET